MPIEAGYLEHTDNQVYVFKGDRMICIKVIPGTIIDKIVWGPEPFETAWKALDAIYKKF